MKVYFKEYLKRFNRGVIKRLGGVEMAEEFFVLHPEMVDKMKASAKYHFRKGGAAWKGAAIWFKLRVTPLLKEDRIKACAMPW